MRWVVILLGVSLLVSVTIIAFGAFGSNMGLLSSVGPRGAANGQKDSGKATLSNNPSSSDWTVNSPTWTVTDGLLDGSGLTYLSPKIISTAKFPSDRTVRVEARTISPGYGTQCNAWIIGKYVDFFDKVFMLIHTSPFPGLVEVSVYQGATHHIYYSSGVTNLNSSDWHDFKLVFSGDTAKAYVDGHIYVTADDPIIGALGVSQVSLASWCNSESVFDKTTISWGTHGSSDETPNGLSTSKEPMFQNIKASSDLSTLTLPDATRLSYIHRHLSSLRAELISQ